ncbi:MAG TPA: hypothetical protein DDX40_00425 [Rikenellaceae bacterium]|nr:hypothetical protein [Rikenellaceae bacterium]
MKTNNIFICTAAAIILAGSGIVAAAQESASVSVKGGKAKPSVDGVVAKDAKVTRDGSNVVVDMSLDISDLKVKNTKAVLLTPFLVKGRDSLALPAIGVYGRQRYYYYLRKDDGKMISGENETSFRTGSDEDVLDYHAVTPHKDWMNNSRLVLERSEYSCCEKRLGDQTAELLSRVLWVPETPRLIYVCPKGEKTKTRSLSGTAYVDFPVDKTEIYPEYHNNVAELGRIRATIDSVRNDKDITVTSIWLKGFASPEGTYAHNTDLARERTATIRGYVLNLYNFDPSIVTFEHEPENWEGLIEWLRTSGLKDAGKILAIAEDTATDPDVREWKIKKYYQEDYAVMKAEIYPRLRCTKYRIEYSIRGYRDPAEILQVMRARPSKLSLEEFFLAAESLEPGSPEFNTAFETAAVMYPDDPVANLNAANAAMERGDLATAVKRLEKAGESGEAEYARGVLAVMSKEYSDAVRHFRAASARGIMEAVRQAEIFHEYSGYSEQK